MREGHAGGAGDGHLGGNVDGKVGREVANEPADADVLHDGGIDPGGDDGAQIFLSGGHFVFKNERIEGDIAFYAAPMEKFHEFGQIIAGKILRAHPGVELVQAEVDGIGAVLHGGAGAFPVAGGREQFRQARRIGLRGRSGGGNGAIHRQNILYRVDTWGKKEFCRWMGTPGGVQR